MVEHESGFILGLDLHGTLLEPGEVLREELVEPIREGLDRLRGRAQRFICTGNDLAFVLKKIPDRILAEIDGCVLETGCSASPELRTEQVLTTPEEQARVRELETRLREARFCEVNYFAHRLTTISMFCDDPRSFYEKVAEFVQPTEFSPRVDITYSSVAVDVLPRGYNKFKGLKALSGARKTIGIADSMNDRALLIESDHALAPANLAPELKPLLDRAGKKIVPLDRAGRLEPGVLLVASQKETQGVIEILEFLARVL